MIKWRTGKAGFIGASKSLIKTFFRTFHTATSASVAVANGFGVYARISDAGQGVIGEISDTGQGVIGVLNANGQGVYARINDNGKGVVGSISDSGQGVSGVIL